MPVVPRNRGGIRQYAEHHVQYVVVIQSLKASGMALDDIIRYMKLAREGERTARQRRYGRIFFAWGTYCFFA